MGDRFFATEILGLEARTEDGKRLGKIDDIVADTESGEMRFLLLKDCSEMCGRFRTDPDGRKIVEFRTMDITDGAAVLVLRP
jgi:sporulation protein YlmC with PRC-barrel domain